MKKKKIGRPLFCFWGSVTVSLINVSQLFFTRGAMMDVYPRWPLLFFLFHFFISGNDPLLCFSQTVQGHKESIKHAHCPCHCYCCYSCCHSPYDLLLSSP
ncbi:hypothetical protein BKA57DRAFT_464672 [Linnemannia elongata]|nr:hypothetical protein BKA57DRAFT_464672 [Linnemannia elongata]